MKNCKITGCNNPIFAKDLCLYHQFHRRMRGGDLYKQKPRIKSELSKESKKAKVLKKRYLERLDELWANAIENKTNKCFFCGEVILKREDNHHVRGRGGFMLTEEFWVWSHRLCHSKYHSLGVDMLMQEDWYKGFLSRLKVKDILTYQKELNKGKKYANLFD